MTCDLVIENAAVLTVDPAWNLYEPGFLAVRGDTIAAVGPMAGRRGWEARTVV
ncbi:MAG: amidohydrolase, partial [Treponema sp.]|nr:amidohydrolase [Treponema sp.]